MTSAAHAPILLNDNQLQSFLRSGYLTVDAGLPAAFHTRLHGQIQHLFATDGNPGNDILPLVPDLHQVLTQPRVHGALTSLLGPDYLLHPHRHCHLNPAGSDGQRLHQDSYEADQNVRHHRLRWLLAFYYPQDVDANRGPSAIVPATQYLTRSDRPAAADELPLQGRAGTVTIVHYDLWHRAMANVGTQDRFMVKFLFTRVCEPREPSWCHDGTPWPSTGRADDVLCASLWDWICGAAVDGGPVARVSGPDDGLVEDLVEGLGSSDESERHRAAYRLGGMDASGAEALLAALRLEGQQRLQPNIERAHTNPVQFDAAYGLTAAGVVAVPALTKLLADEIWWLRASAADVLGDIGLYTEEGVQALTTSLKDPSEWVRRNAVEALGNIGPPAGCARNALALCLADPDDAVRYNAALALAKITSGDRVALQAAQCDSNRYVRELATEALARG
ncbi:MAG: HEAT repeat domain-containing protein [bacterium]|nr:HEAT repeat domain-containing protein [bacterium]